MYHCHRGAKYQHVSLFSLDCSRRWRILTEKRVRSVICHLFKHTQFNSGSMLLNGVVISFCSIKTNSTLHDSIVSLFVEGTEANLWQTSDTLCSASNSTPTVACFYFCPKQFISKYALPWKACKKFTFIKFVARSFLSLMMIQPLQMVHDLNFKMLTSEGSEKHFLNIPYLADSNLYLTSARFLFFVNFIRFGCVTVKTFFKLT